MDQYSTYDAKARFSEILRKVREGKTVTVSYHGRPLAEIRPVDTGGEDADARVLRLVERGVLVRGGGTRALRAVAKRPGALKRFLRDRD
jgi:prevent-host-death family protein